MSLRIAILVRAAAGMAALVLAAGLAPAAEPFPMVPGAAFTLTDQQGNTRRSEEFRGRLSLVYFGYTSCPHSCGMALNSVSAALDALGEEAARVSALFVSLDPEYDDPRRLAAYLENFHPSIVGLTGTAGRIDALRAAYRVSAAAAADAGGFDRLIEHSTFIYLVGPDGRPLSLLPPMLPPERITAIVRNRLQGVSHASRQ